MGRERWRRLEDVFREARSCEASERAAYLDDACRGDAELRAEVESLLAALERSPGSLEDWLAAPTALNHDSITAAEAVAGTIASDRMAGSGPSPGEMLAGRYRLEAEIGRGGMGIVFRAADLAVGGDVAVKVVRSGAPEDLEAVTRFKREAAAMTRLDHPNVVRVLDSGMTGGSEAFIVMELLVGRSLREELAVRGRLPVGEALPLMRELCEAVTAVHEAGIIHRDLKPENVFLITNEGGGRAKLLDFGIARIAEAVGATVTSLTPTGAFVGTPVYAPPEQWDGERLDERSDIYSLGCVFYEMVAGRPPFAAGNIARLLRQHTLEAPEPLLGRVPDVPPAMEVAIQRALAKRREERFPSARVFGKALTARLAL